MKKKFLLLVSSLLSIIISAQTFTVSAVPEKINWRIGVGDFSKLPAGGFLSMAYEGNAKVAPWGIGGRYFTGDLVIRRFGADLVEKQSGSIHLDEIDSDAGLLKMAVLNDKIFVFYAKKGSSKNITDVNLIEVDGASLKAIKESTLLTGEISDARASLALSISAQNKYALLKIREKSQTKSIELFRLIVLNSEGSKFRTVKYQLGETLWLQKAVVDDIGSVHVVLEDKADKNSTNIYVEHYTGPENSKPKKQVIDFAEHFNQYSDVYANTVTNKYYLTGTFQNKKDGSGAGVFIAEINEAASKTKPVFQQFDDALLSRLDEDDIAKKSGKDPGLKKGCAPANFLTRADGSMDLLVEYNLSSGTERSVIFYSGSIIDAHIKDNKITFVRIPKTQQQAITNAYQSNYALTIENKLVILYNDKEENLSKAIENSPSKMTTPKNSILAAVMIDENNNVQRKMIWDNGDGRYATELLSSVGLTNNKVVLVQSQVGVSKYSYRMGLLEVGR